MNETMGRGNPTAPLAVRMGVEAMAERAAFVRSTLTQLDGQPSTMGASGAAPDSLIHGRLQRRYGPLTRQARATSSSAEVASELAFSTAVGLFVFPCVRDPDLRAASCHQPFGFTSSSLDLDACRVLCRTSSSSTRRHLSLLAHLTCQHDALSFPAHRRAGSRPSYRP